MSKRIDPGSSEPADFIDEVVEEWENEVPSLDSLGLEIGGRIVVLSRHIERRTDRYLSTLDLQNWGFDVLAALLRAGEPYSQTPKQLMRSCFLTSGAITNRLKHLESRGLVTRHQSDTDKRSWLVTLTEKGLALTREGIHGRVEFMRDSFDIFAPKERAQFISSLRKLLCHLEELEGWS